MRRKKFMRNVKCLVFLSGLKNSRSARKKCWEKVDQKFFGKPTLIVSFSFQTNGSRSVGLILVTGQWGVCIIVAIFSVLLLLWSRLCSLLYGICLKYSRTSLYSHSVLCQHLKSSHWFISFVSETVNRRIHEPFILQCYYSQIKGDRSMSLWTKRCIHCQKDINFRYYWL